MKCLIVVLTFCFLVIASEFATKIILKYLDVRRENDKKP